MNIYGERARRHWQEQRPHAYSQLEDPEAFFTDFGERLAAQISRVQDELLNRADTPEPGDDYLANMRRMRTTRADAESVVLNQEVYADSEEPEDAWSRKHASLDERIEQAEQNFEVLLGDLDDRD